MLEQVATTFGALLDAGVHLEDARQVLPAGAMMNLEFEATSARASSSESSSVRRHGCYSVALHVLVRAAVPSTTGRPTEPFDEPLN